MAAISHFFFLILYQPLVNALIFLYNTVALHDLGISIILLTLVIRLLLFPFFHKSARQQTIMQRLQPKLKAIQAEHKEDRVKQTEAMMALYREHQVNPFSGFLFLLIQIPVLITLYRIFLYSLSPGAFAPALYHFVKTPAEFHASFLGLINLGSRSILMVAAAAIAQFFQGRLALPKRTDSKTPLSAQEQITRNMMYVGPLLTLFIFYNFPAAVSLYWLVSSLFSIVQQIVINRDIAKHGTLGTVSEKPH
ncbi:MAG: YidC/Oxa1 family membrane protein insertase [bacterium]